MKRYLLSLTLTRRFFLAAGFVVALFVFSFAADDLFPIAQLLLAVLILLAIVDTARLYRSSLRLECHRIVPRLMSLGDENSIHISLANLSALPLSVFLVDELPDQFQERNPGYRFALAPVEKKLVTYSLRPVTRGEYRFHNIHTLIASGLGFVRRRITFPGEMAVPVYPSIQQMKNVELKAFSRISSLQGIKRLRRLGHSYEFEQIKNYVRGDDFRSINWKATGRKADLMVNQYEDERAQQVYSVLDCSRSMQMPFAGMSLLDYAINATLVFSNIALRRQDKAGLISFADKTQTLLTAGRDRSRLRQIADLLYRQEVTGHEANYELLYTTIRHVVKGRSLLFLYTNFESLYALERVLPVLRKLNRLHLLVVVFFENTEITGFGRQHAETLRDVYFKTVAQVFASEKTSVIQKLKQYGIQAIFTPPAELSVNTVNKYLELKARGMI